jgi:hypothetical protein
MSWVNSLIKRLYLPMSVAGLGSLSTGNVVRGSTLVGMVVTESDRPNDPSGSFSVPRERQKSADSVEKFGFLKRPESDR